MSNKSHHRYADIHPDAQIAKDVEIGPFTTIAADVTIGSGTKIGPHVSIMSGARIGAHCQIFPGAVIAAVPQDLKFRGETTTAIIGDYTTIREYVTISKGTAAHGVTQIGKNALLMAYVHVGHDCVIGDNVILANGVQLSGHVALGDYVTIGGTAALRQFVKVGSYAMIGGGSLVRKDVPPFIKAAREPVKYCGLNVIGLKRHGFTTQQLATLKWIYGFIFQHKVPLQAALSQIMHIVPMGPEKEAVLQFIQAATLGIIR